MENLISIIISTYNRKEFITNAIDSVLNQRYKNVEIIVVDDCSTDGTNAYILDTISGVYRIHSNNISFSLKADFIIENLMEKRKYMKK